MSLFDTIRFSNIDISNNDELKKLPRPLLVAWMKEITTGMDWAKVIDYTKPDLNVAGLAHSVGFYLAHQSQPYANGTITFDVLKDIYLKQFTFILKKMIAEYETETL